VAWEQRINQVVFTNKARCKDCYRCIRICPVDAIGIRDGQAYVDEQRCISCGNCIRECPQGAKSFRRDLDGVRELIASGRPVAASLAPSFAAIFAPWQIRRVPSALRQLGFRHVSETAVGAYPVARRTAEWAADHADTVSIATACPVVVNYIERYRPDLVESLAAVCSPMVAHARMLKERLGPDAGIVFIGPCVAKKQEARDKSGDAVDLALTFTELLEWFEQEQLDLEDLEESDFDMAPEGWARSFPVAGGMLETASLNTSPLSVEILSITGAQEIHDVLEGIGGHRERLLIEPMFCAQGCINGPAMPDSATVHQRRRALLRYAKAGRQETGQPNGRVDLTARFCGQTAPQQDVTEEQIRQVYAQTGKEDEEDRLNCGACGYSSCREQAFAVARNMAEPGMCVPHMRRLAEQRTDRIIETSPNGIVILDEHLCLLHVNPSFKRMFMCSEAVYGKPISYLVDSEPFEQIAAGKRDLIEVTVEHAKYSLVCHQIVYALREEKQYVGVFVNLTSSLMNQKQLDTLRAQTVQQARDLLTHQIEIAGKIAQFLGESSAQSERLLDNLVRMARENATRTEDGKGAWLRNTSTST
jgi:iron only hydrogenase large subunit-like protein